MSNYFERLFQLLPKPEENLLRLSNVGNYDETNSSHGPGHSRNDIKRFVKYPECIWTAINIFKLLITLFFL